MVNFQKFGLATRKIKKEKPPSYTGEEIWELFVVIFVLNLLNGWTI